MAIAKCAPVLLSRGLKTKDVTLSALFAILTGIGAWIFLPVPVSPVPITVQTLFVLLSGALLGSRLGSLSQLVYLMLGTVGLPVFSRGNSGPGVLLGPTGGYLLGFVLGAYVTGRIVETSLTGGFRRALVATIAGLFGVYILGSVQLWLWSSASLTWVVSIGVVPFLPGDLLKATIAAYIASRKHVRSLLYASLNQRN